MELGLKRFYLREPLTRKISSRDSNLDCDMLLWLRNQTRCKFNIGYEATHSDDEDETIISSSDLVNRSFSDEIVMVVGRGFLTISFRGTLNPYSNACFR